MTYAETIPAGWGRKRRRHHGMHMFSRRRHGGAPFGRGGWGGGPGNAFFGGGRRAGRGDIRAAILALLSEQGMHGYQIIRELSERTGGAWNPSPGSVYPTLQQLEDEELVRTVRTDGRRVFELTDAGREQAAALPSQTPWESAGDGDDDLAALRDLAFQLLGATRQVALAGSAKQIESAQAILREARRGIYQLLAEDGEGDAEGDAPS